MSKYLVIYLFDCLRYSAAKTMQTIANKMAAVNVKPANTGEIGIFEMFEGPEKRKELIFNCIKLYQFSGQKGGPNVVRP